MKKLFLFLFFTYLGHTQAQVISQDQRQIVKFFKERILQNDTTRFNYFISNTLIEPKSLIPTLIKSVTIISPDYKSWVFFVDEHPFQSWSHSCKYIFVDENGRYEVINHNMPPKLDIFTPINILKIADQIPIKLMPSITTKSSICRTTDDWAVIINGGMDSLNNHERYWNHISALYKTLINKYNYQESHIIVLNSDGTSSGTDRHLNNGNYDSSPLDLDGDSDNDIDYSATSTNIHTVFEMLSDSIDGDEDLFIYTTDHGYQDSGNDVYLCLWGESISDDDFADEIALITASNILITLVQCSSGGFIDDLADQNRVIITSCTASQSASSAYPYNYSEFTYDWIAAMAGETPDTQNPVDADSNNDNYISLNEAFIYARDHDAFISTETPQYSSNPSNLGPKLTLLGVIPSLTGNYYACYSNTTYTINDLPNGATVTWHKSDNLDIVSSNSSSLTVIPNDNGSGWVEARIYFGSCDPLYLGKSIWVGSPNSLSFIDVSDPLCRYSYIGFYSENPGYPGNPPNPPDTYYYWRIESEIRADIYYGQGTLYPSVYSYDVGDITLSVAAQNECGSSDYFYSDPFYIDDCFLKLLLSPNPAGDRLKISLSDEPAIGATIEIFNSQSVKVISTFMQGKEKTIDISGLPKGIYYVTLFNKGKGITEKLIKE